MGTMEWHKAFALGVAGAFVAYYVLYRNSRIAEFLEDPALNWKTLAFDLTVFLSCGGLVTVFLAQPCTAQGAFMAGCGWLGLIGGLTAGRDLRKVREYTEKRKTRGL